MIGLSKSCGILVGLVVYILDLWLCIGYWLVFGRAGSNTSIFWILGLCWTGTASRLGCPSYKEGAAQIFGKIFQNNSI
ncbi:uncharacterized protein M6B38_137155 [Iris pallida]|uniref:Uncharacterized protein n=1 Tax=Iris pallida TaxID=29817 RepID=A0AAX6FG01_IRIPA|nr:uncharacterized protein M6B38_137155 [Iris pallida]